MSKIVLCGDPHASPLFSNQRFEWLGNLIFDINPDIVICTGDMGDMPSLSSYDKHKKASELRRYKDDIASVHDALNKINTPLDLYNRQRKNIRKSVRKAPRKIMLMGNHDGARIDRAVELSAELEGVISQEDFKYKEHGWEQIPYKTPIEIEGIWACHHLPSGVMGTPISGYNIAANLLAKHMVSCLVGHSHLLDWAIRSKPNGDKLMAISAGCYLEEPTFLDATEQLWWKGICILHNAHNGCWDLETIEMGRVKALYS